MTQQTEHAWNVLGIFDPDQVDESFLYTVGLFESYGLPELWVRCLGECGHRVGMEGAHYVINTIADKLALGELDPGQSYSEVFQPTGATLVFTLGLPEEGVDPETYQTYQVPSGAPVLPITWICCDRVRSLCLHCECYVWADGEQWIDRFGEHNCRTCEEHREHSQPHQG